MDPTRRFTDRVDRYVRFRPGYPPGVFDRLERTAGLGPGRVVADVGSGTGIFSALLLERGAAVMAVEPNHAMREAAERQLGRHPRFRSVAGSAEATGLPAASIDLVTVAQAFHWFDPGRFRAECTRILKDGSGPVALVWNDRRTAATPFLTAYEELLRRRGTDYLAVRSENVGPEVFQAFFDGGAFDVTLFESSQVFDWEGLLGRVLSSSYLPTEGTPGHHELIRELRELYEKHASDGRVVFAYDTRVYCGRVSRGGH